MIFSLFQIQAGNRFVVSHQVCTVKFIGHYLCTWAMISYLKHQYETLLRADRLTFDGGGGVTTSGFLHM